MGLLRQLLGHDDALDFGGEFDRPTRGPQCGRWGTAGPERSFISISAFAPKMASYDR
jgi:hypothetical protein